MEELKTEKHHHDSGHKKISYYEKVRADAKLQLLLFIALFVSVGMVALFVSQAAITTTTTNSGCLDGMLKNGITPIGYEANKIPNNLQPTPESITNETKVFVSKICGNDANNGLTQTTSVKTISQALEIVKNRTTGNRHVIFLDFGVYRESLGNINYPLTIQPMPGRNAWLSGSDQITEWSKLTDRSVWKSILPLSNSQLCQKCRPADAIGSEPTDNFVTLSDNPAMVFINGEPLKQVKDLASVVPGTFAVVKENSTLVTDASTAHNYNYYIGSDPTAKNVEVTTRIQAFSVNADNVTLRGIGIRNYGSNYNFCRNCTAATRPAKPAGVVVQNQTNFTLKDSYIGYSATDGMMLGGNLTTVNNHLISNNTFENNGHRGLAIHETNTVTIKNNRINKNNLEGFRAKDSQYATAAGIKITSAKNILFDSNLLDSNNATGFWCDLGCFNADIVRNVAKNNAHHGIFYEISAKSNIVDNLIINNATRGLSISSGDANDPTKGVKVYNNTILGNAENAVKVYQITADQVANRSRCNNINGVTCLTGNVMLINNYFSNLGQNNSSGPLVIIDGIYRPASALVSAMNNNVYYLSIPCAGSNRLLSWKTSAYSQTACNISQIRSITGRETNSKHAITSDQFLFNSDYSPSDGNIGLSSGQLILSTLRSEFPWLPASATPNVGIVK